MGTLGMVLKREGHNVKAQSLLWGDLANLAISHFSDSTLTTHGHLQEIFFGSPPLYYSYPNEIQTFAAIKASIITPLVMAVENGLKAV